MENITYFETPKQVLWWDSDSDIYRYGIAYHSEIICSCCGGIFEIDEILEFCHERIKPIIPLEWVDLCEFGMGAVDEYCYIIQSHYSKAEIVELATIYDSFAGVKKFLSYNEKA